MIFWFSNKRIYICSCKKSTGTLAQLVEQRTENPCVPGSIPGGTTKNPCNLLIYKGLIFYNHFYVPLCIPFSGFFLYLFGTKCVPQMNIFLVQHFRKKKNKYESHENVKIIVPLTNFRPSWVVFSFPSDGEKVTHINIEKMRKQM